ncbi:MAG: hypothetical protein EA411_03005 [Saprospirales bacterium]|nr:MAG: hypothetical protein EA411_03005 [Saprospirales bacterium]
MQKECGKLVVCSKEEDFNSWCLESDRNLTKSAFVYYYSVITNKEKAMESLESISSIIKRGTKNAYEEILIEGYEKAQRENIEEQKATIRKSVVNYYKPGTSVHQISIALEIPESEIGEILHNEGLI